MTETCVDLPGLLSMRSLGDKIAAELEPGDVIALSGPLGSGKTTLARATIAALGYTTEVPSPTFTIIETYEPPAIRLPVVHADFYRLSSREEAMEIGLDDYRAEAVLIAEWPDRIGGFDNDERALSIALETVGSGRRAVVTPGKAWLRRWP